MKRRGFTLIELLAVIVILAIIALIATPIVLDIIEDSKINSNKRSIELYGGAVENAVAKAQLNGQAIPSGKYTTEDGKTLIQGDTTLKVDYNGSKTVCDVYVSSKGTVSLKNCSVNNKRTNYKYGEIYNDGETVYFDVKEGKVCTKEKYEESKGTVEKSGYGIGPYDGSIDDTIQDYQNSKDGYNGINGTDKQNSCLKFYVFNDDGESDKLNLLLDHNITEWPVAWRVSEDGSSSSSGCIITNWETNECDCTPKALLQQLKTNTDAWVGTEVPTNYSLEQEVVKYTIDYSEYKARLITANEIAQITGNTTFDEKTSSEHFYFDTNTKTSSNTCNYDYSTKTSVTTGCNYGWLYDRVAIGCTSYGCLNDAGRETYGYWTATIVNDDISYAWDASAAWGVFYNGELSKGNFNESYSLRPVIEVLKSKLN